MLGGFTRLILPSVVAWARRVFSSAVALASRILGAKFFSGFINGSAVKPFLTLPWMQLFLNVGNEKLGWTLYSGVGSDENETGKPTTTADGSATKSTAGATSTTGKNADPAAPTTTLLHEDEVPPDFVWAQFVNLAGDRFFPFWFFEEQKVKVERKDVLDTTLELVKSKFVEERENVRKFYRWQEERNRAMMEHQYWFFRDILHWYALSEEGKPVLAGTAQDDNAGESTTASAVGKPQGKGETKNEAKQITIRSPPSQATTSTAVGQGEGAASETSRDAQPQDLNEGDENKCDAQYRARADEASTSTMKDRLVEELAGVSVSTSSTTSSTSAGTGCNEDENAAATRSCLSSTSGSEDVDSEGASKQGQAQDQGDHEAEVEQEPSNSTIEAQVDERENGLHPADEEPAPLYCKLLEIEVRLLDSEQRELEEYQTRLRAGGPDSPDHSVLLEERTLLLRFWEVENQLDSTFQHCQGTFNKWKRSKDSSEAIGKELQKAHPDFNEQIAHLWEQNRVAQRGAVGTRRAFENQRRGVGKEFTKTATLQVFMDISAEFVVFVDGKFVGLMKDFRECMRGTTWALCHLTPEVMKEDENGVLFFNQLIPVIGRFYRFDKYKCDIPLDEDETVGSAPNPTTLADQKKSTVTGATIRRECTGPAPSFRLLRCGESDSAGHVAGGQAAGTQAGDEPESHIVHAHRKCVILQQLQRLASLHSPACRAQYALGSMPLMKSLSQLSKRKRPLTGTTDSSTITAATASTPSTERTEPPEGGAASARATAPSSPSRESEKKAPEVAADEPFPVRSEQDLTTMTRALADLKNAYPSEFIVAPYFCTSDDDLLFVLQGKQDGEDEEEDVATPNECQTLLDHVDTPCGSSGFGRDEGYNFRESEYKQCLYDSREKRSPSPRGPISGLASTPESRRFALAEGPRKAAAKTAKTGVEDASPNSPDEDAARPYSAGSALTLTHSDEKKECISETETTSSSHLTTTSATSSSSSSTGRSPATTAGSSCCSSPSVVEAEAAAGNPSLSNNKTKDDHDQDKDCSSPGGGEDGPSLDVYNVGVLIKNTEYLFHNAGEASERNLSVTEAGPSGTGAAQQRPLHPVHVLELPDDMSAHLQPTFTKEEWTKMQREGSRAALNTEIDHVINNNYWLMAPAPGNQTAAT
ncbi:unnamed protein product [Amoebophrya sp. A120]|nr:unnamed protein product [Amoebophrya sp. A120]|eukprot:GSA120T00003974001.1